jgi:hypothetical protein
MEQSNFKKFLILIWPTVYRIINSTFYFLIRFIKSSVRLMISQLKGGY